MDKILVIQVAALGHEFLKKHTGGGDFCGLTFGPMDSVFPATTCPVQASFRTASTPSDHGVVGNGFFSREFSRPFFWEQSSSLVSGKRFWEPFRASGKSVGVIFWQQSLGTDADIVLSPAPIHKHHGGMIQDCFSRPEGLYAGLKREIGRGFNLMHYWGPWASRRSTEWIVEATKKVMSNPGPDLLLTYLPHLDYELQKSGPDSAAATQAFDEIRGFLGDLVEGAHKAGYHVIVFGDYAIMQVSRPVHPNRTLREAGFMSVRRIGKMLYPDLYASRAFAVVDHQVAHVIVKDPTDIGAVRDVLSDLSGVAKVLDADGKREAGIDHPRAGDLVLVAERDSWFAYPWWTSASETPDYATHVDIHSKPGYDPCELFTGWWPFATSTDASKICGSHGLVGKNLEVSWATDIPLESAPRSIVALGRAIGEQLDRRAST